VTNNSKKTADPDADERVEPSTNKSQQRKSTTLSSTSPTLQSAPLYRNPTTGLFFNNYAEAVTACIVPQWSPVSPDDTIPTSNAERQVVVVKLVQALQNRNRNEDKKGHVYKCRWGLIKSDGSVKEFYNEQAMEKVCWEIEVCVL
jgi:hypothetical protein